VNGEGIELTSQHDICDVANFFWSGSQILVETIRQLSSRVFGLVL